MLKELLLIRHAHALPATGAQADAQRALSPAGREDALAAGSWLRDTVGPPDVVLCSPAQRTRETLAQLVRAGLHLPAPDWEPDIYEASLGDLLTVIETRMAAVAPPTRLWLIGHNPGLESMLRHLDAAARLHAMPPAGIAWLQFDGCGAPTSPGAARILATWAP